MSFIIYPALDLRAGRVVRLRQGDPRAQTVFSGDPAEVAKRWSDEGASWLHVVSLDGALGEVGNGCTEAEVGPGRSLAAIRAASSLPIQFGGGMRTVADVGRALDLGATRVVLGTVAVTEPTVVREAVARFGAERIVVGIDTRAGVVATHGWQRSAALDALSLATPMADLGITRLVFTDIARDGTLEGANLDATCDLARATGLRIIASGGVGNLADVSALAQRSSDGIEGVIIGQALYTGALSLPEALALQQA